LKECKEHNWGILQLPSTPGSMNAAYLLTWSGLDLNTTASQIFCTLSQLSLGRGATPDQHRQDFQETFSALCLVGQRLLPTSQSWGCGKLISLLPC